MVRILGWHGEGRRDARAAGCALRVLRAARLARCVLHGARGTATRRTALAEHDRHVRNIVRHAVQVRAAPLRSARRPLPFPECELRALAESGEQRRGALGCCTSTKASVRAQASVGFWGPSGFRAPLLGSNLHFRQELPCNLLRMSKGHVRRQVPLTRRTLVRCERTHARAWFVRARLRPRSNCFSVSICSVVAFWTCMSSREYGGQSLLATPC